MNTKMPPKRYLPLRKNQITEILILVGLSVLLLLYLLFRSVGNFSYKLPEFAELSKSEIQKIRWSRKDGSEQIFEKQGDTWYLGSEKYPAKQSYVDTLVEQLSKPSLQDLVSKSGNLLTFGLDEERAYHVEAFASDGSELRQFYLGKSSSSGRYSYVRMSEEDTSIYTLSENLSSIVEKSSDELRDRVVMKFSSSEIEGLQIDAKGESISTSKKDNEWQIPEDVVWDKDKVQSLINRFANMNAQDFIAQFPQTDQLYEIKFIAKGGVVYTITIAAQKEDGANGYAAKSSSYGFPFTLNNYTVESMLEDFGFVPPPPPPPAPPSPLGLGPLGPAGAN